MTTTELVDALAGHKTVGAAPRAELEWLASRGTLRHLDTGETLTPRASRVDKLVIILAGRIAIFLDRGAGPQKILEWRAGDVTGFLPYSRVLNPPGDTVAQEPTTVLAVDRDQVQDMIRDCHQVTSILVHSMLDRARAFTTSDLHVEKMASLGKLSAGLAHELNNPVSAIERSAALLGSRLADAEHATRALGAARMTDAQLAAADAGRAACLAPSRGLRSPLQQSEHEDAIAGWLGSRGLDTAIAEPLADTAVTIESLEALITSLDPAALETVLRWLAAGCVVRGLASEIQEAATRISGLVTAIKGFTHMDQASVAEPVDVTHGLNNTIAVLRSKARQKSASVVVEGDSDLPRVRGFVGELNQIWVNLLDNALDAIPDGGRVDVRASRDGHGRVTVRIVDNGSGIPEPVRARIFDPFFTTKPVGQGTGLGLDIVRRLVLHNEGEISVESQPGRTEFTVVLPGMSSDGPRARS